MTNPESDSINLLIDTLRRQYLQLVPPTEIDIPPIPSSLLHDDSFQHRLYSEVFSPNLNTDVPSPRYASRVLKRIITMIEDSTFKEGYGCHEINEDLIDFYATLLVPSSSGYSIPQNRNHVTYTVVPFDESSSSSTFNPADTITLHESRSIISGSGTTGARTWEAAMALGEFLIHEHVILKSRTAPGFEQEHKNNDRRSWDLSGLKVLELGAGTGFLSILAARLGAERVLATDGDWGVCEVLQTNVDENRVGDVVKVQRLLWGDVDETGDADGGTEHHSNGNENGVGRDIDLIIGADVTYDSTVIPRLVSQLNDTFCKSPKAQALIAATIRNEVTFESFQKACQANMLTMRELDTWTPPTPRTIYYPTSTPIKFIHISGS